jgi:succinate dehydrogenase / fumarate reductase cytochrome b subunit
MRESVKLYSSSIGQKLLVGLTGLFLCSFLLIHLSGNLLLFKNDRGKAFEAYSEFMSTNPGIRILEVGLFTGFLIHILFGIRVWVHNRKARPVQYLVNRGSENSTFSSRWMLFNGSIVFVFLAFHLYSFFVPTRFGDAPHAPIYDLVREAFSSPYYVVFYLASMIVLGCHLRQGFQGAFQTFGIRPGWRKPIDILAIVFWLFIPVGFASMPIYFLWTHLARGN